MESQGHVLKNRISIEVEESGRMAAAVIMCRSAAREGLLCKLLGECRSKKCVDTVFSLTYNSDKLPLSIEVRKIRKEDAVPNGCISYFKMAINLRRWLTRLEIRPRSF